MVGHPVLLRERTGHNVINKGEAIRTLIEDAAIWNLLIREVFDMCSTFRATVVAATAMHDLADLGYRFTIGPQQRAVNEPEPFLPDRKGQ